jgi:hypothetical protein
MHDYLGQLRRGLLKEGCSIQRICRMMGEVSDHREDLMEAWRAKGVPAADAQARAELALGDPQELAVELAAAQRRSSWFGRHGLVAFGLLPVVGFPVLWALLLAGELWLICGLGFGWDEQKLHLVGDDPVRFRHWANVGYGADYVAIALGALLFCWLARRTGARWAWLGCACLICSALAGSSYLNISSHNLFFGFDWRVHWSRAVIPWVVAGAIYLWHWRAARALRAAAPA